MKKVDTTFKTSLKRHELRQCILPVHTTVTFTAAERGFILAFLMKGRGRIIENSKQTVSKSRIFMNSIDRIELDFGSTFTTCLSGEWDNYVFFANVWTVSKIEII